jgi:hypothetical protein
MPHRTISVDRVAIRSDREKRGPVRFRFSAAAVILAISLVASYGQTSATHSPTKKHVATQKAKTPPPPTVEEQIQALRHELENQAIQIERLKTGLVEKDARLKNAEQEAVDAQAAAARAEAAATSQQRAVSETAAAVTRLNQATKNLAAPPAPPAPPQPTEPAAPPTKAINLALTPIRVFPVDGVQKNDLHPAFKAEGVGITPYGIVKVTAVEDSSSPNGDDFPLPGFVATDTGPNGSPEFHLKARGTRFGANFDWYDANKKWVLTGKIEADFEGNFNRSDNRNISSVRSNNPSLRLAWARMDYHFDANNAFSALFGQDWTTFGSSTLPNMLETTGLGIAYGSLYERDPQMRVGYTHKANAFSIMPEFAIDLPASGYPPSAANISSQLGYGERQGPDANRPEVQGRIVGQWQLDHAPGVAPAQIIFSGFNGKRTAIVLASAVPTAYQSTFPTGVSADSKQDGWDAEWQLPTRWFTLSGKVYGGSDLRWFFAGQLYSFYSDTTGLTGTATASSVDGASSVIFGTNSSSQKVVAPERPIRAAGGFAQLGLPLSRIFNANPTGRNSGWSLYVLYGVDQAKARDLDRIAGTRHMSTMAVGTLNYKFNKWAAFSFEQSLYTTHANKEVALPLFRGVPSREWNDVREEAGPVFTF